MKTKTAPSPAKPPAATMTIEDAASELGISRHTAYQCARDGQIPTIRLGRRLVVPRVRLEAMLRGEAAPRETA